METLEAVYIGDDFYWKSKTMMSSIYLKTDKGFERYDYGFLQRDLRKGHCVNVRPATEDELIYFTKALTKEG